MVIGKQQKRENFGENLAIGFRSANHYHRVDLKPGTRPMTIFISGPYGLRKGPRSDYGIDFNSKKN